MVNLLPMMKEPPAALFSAILFDIAVRNLG